MSVIPIPITNHQEVDYLEIKQLSQVVSKWIIEELTLPKLTPVNVEGPLEEPRDVVLQDGEGLVELLQHPHHGVVLLHVLLRLPHRDLGVKPTKQRLG